MTAKRKHVQLIGEIQPDQVYRVDQSSAIFGYGPQSIRNKIKNGQLPQPAPLSASSRFLCWTGQQVLDHRAQMRELAEQRAKADRDRPVQPQPLALQPKIKKLKKATSAQGGAIMMKAMAASMKAHPLAELFPLIEGEEFESLVSDIKANGQREPIVLFKEKILDGRNRYRACMRARIEPMYKTYKGKDPLGFVISLNLKRRHLNESQRAWVASKIANLPQGGQSEGPANLPVSLKVAQADAATMLNVSERSIRSSAAIRNNAQLEIQRAVEQGHLTVNLGVQASKLSKSDQRKIATRAETGGNVKPFFRELIKAKDEARVLSLAPVAGKFRRW
jgi:ParB-like nuclease family protein